MRGTDLVGELQKSKVSDVAGACVTSFKGRKGTDIGILHYTVKNPPHSLHKWWTLNVLCLFNFCILYSTRSLLPSKT